MKRDFDTFNENVFDSIATLIKSSRYLGYRIHRGHTTNPWLWENGFSRRQFEESLPQRSRKNLYTTTCYQIISGP